MISFLHVVTLFTFILLVLKIGILVGAKRYGDEETEIVIDVIGLIPYGVIAIWGLTIILKG